MNLPFSTNVGIFLVNALSKDIGKNIFAMFEEIIEKIMSRNC